MARPLRLEFPGAIYHVTSRGDRREAIYADDEDRSAFVAILGQAADRLDAQLLAYCLMGNHYHLVLHTRQANLGRFMRHLNGVYAQAFNRRHSVVGHVLQGRFKAILVDRDAYLLALCRYVERNPVAAKMVSQAGEWPWSSYRAHVGQAATPPWLDTDGLHGYLLGQPVSGGAQRRKAAAMYAALVAREQADDAGFWQGALRGQIYLGDEDFVARMQALAQPAATAQREVPKPQRMAPRSWAQCLADYAGDRDAALHAAYRRHGLTMTALARATGLSVSRVSRVIAALERGVAGAAPGCATVSTRASTFEVLD